MACSTGPELTERQDDLVGNKPQVWTFSNTESCVDVCGDLPNGQPDTGCVCTNTMPGFPVDCTTGAPAGQSCGVLGARCVVMGSPLHHYTEYSCEVGPPQYYRIASARSGLCLHVGSSASGAAVVQTHCTGVAAQDWWVETPSSTTSRIRNRSTNKCLDIVANFAVQNTCDSRASELFQPESSTRNTMLLRTNASGLGSCVDVPNASMSPNVQVKHFGCKNPAASPTWFAGLDDLSNQLWVFLPNP